MNIFPFNNIRKRSGRGQRKSKQELFSLLPYQFWDVASDKLTHFSSKKYIKKGQLFPMHSFLLSERFAAFRRSLPDRSLFSIIFHTNFINYERPSRHGFPSPATAAYFRFDGCNCREDVQGCCRPLTSSTAPFWLISVAIDQNATKRTITWLRWSRKFRSTSPRIERNFSSASVWRFRFQNSQIVNDVCFYKLCDVIQIVNDI